MSYFLTIYGYFCNISRPLGDDDFTIDITQVEKFFGIFYNTFCGNSNKNLNFPRNKIIFIHVWWNCGERAIMSPKSLFWTSKQPFAILSFIAS